MRSIVWNRHGVPYGIRRRRNGIKTEGGSGYTASRDAIRPTAMPYNSLCELMPYKALRSWIKITEIESSISVIFGGATKVEPMTRDCPFYQLSKAFPFLLVLTSATPTSCKSRAAVSLSGSGTPRMAWYTIWRVPSMSQARIARLVAKISPSRYLPNRRPGVSACARAYWT